jgi:hypothetical protein
MNTPKKFSDLKHLSNVFDVDIASVGIQFEATRIFNENFGEDYRPELSVTTRYLFSGTDDEGNDVKVYEAYKDAGSVDYAYLVAKL